jgi:hypothetical protein
MPALGLALGLPFAAVRGGAAAPAWTPASISAPVWLDVSDLDTMKQERTGASATTAAAVDAVVGSHLNKGTLGGWRTSFSDAARPILRTDGAGHYWLEYDGAGDNFSATPLAGPFRNASLGMIAAAVRTDDTASAKPYAVWQVNGSTNPRIGIYTTNAEHYQVQGRRLDADSTATLTYASAITADVVVRGHIDYGNSNGYVYTDGVQRASSTSFLTDGNTSDTASSGVWFGSFGGSNWKGREYGIVAGNYAHDHADMAALDAYLAELQGRTL